MEGHCCITCISAPLHHKIPNIHQTPASISGFIQQIQQKYLYCCTYGALRDHSRCCTNIIIIWLSLIYSPLPLRLFADSTPHPLWRILIVSLVRRGELGERPLHDPGARRACEVGCQIYCLCNLIAQLILPDSDVEIHTWRLTQTRFCASYLSSASNTAGLQARHRYFGLYIAQLVVDSVGPVLRDLIWHAHYENLSQQNWLRNPPISESSTVNFSYWHHSTVSSRLCRLRRPIKFPPSSNGFENRSFIL